MPPLAIRLFIKPGCPWCDEAEEWLETQQLTYQKLDVLRDSEARSEMQRLTGQSKAPSIEVNGRMLADFSVDELVAWWQQQGFALHA